MKLNGKTIEEFFKNKNIVKIYVGKDNCCRCGCRGDYFYKDNNAAACNSYVKEAFKRFNSMRSSSKLVKSNYMFKDVDGDRVEGFINIPLVNDRCYCIYFRDIYN